MNEEINKTAPKKDKKLIYIILITIGVLAFFVVVGQFYNKYSTKQALELSNADIKNLDEGEFEFTMTDEKGQEVTMKINTEGQEIPSKLKDNLPIFLPSNLISSSDYENYGITGIFKTTAPTSEIKEFYLKEMAKEGWKKSAEFSTDSNIALTYGKDQKTASISIMTEDEQTTFSLTFVDQL